MHNKLLYRKILWALPNPQFLKKLSKLFCFLEDNLALAKFQCPTDTPLNHNLLLLPQHLVQNLFSINFSKLFIKAQTKNSKEKSLLSLNSIKY